MANRLARLVAGLSAGPPESAKVRPDGVPGESHALRLARQHPEAGSRADPVMKREGAAAWTRLP
jgi:hypothetical protein